MYGFDDCYFGVIRHEGTPCVRRLFDSFDADGDGKLRYKEYMKFVKKATLRPELDTLWTMIVKNEKIRKKFKRPMELKAEKTSESYDTISLGQFTAFWYEHCYNILYSSQI